MIHVRTLTNIEYKYSFNLTYNLTLSHLDICEKYGNVKDRLNSLVNAVHNKLEQDRIETLSKSKSNMRPKSKRRRLTRRKLSYTRWRTASTLHERWRTCSVTRHTPSTWTRSLVSKQTWPNLISPYTCPLIPVIFVGRYCGLKTSTVLVIPNPIQCCVVNVWRMTLSTWNNFPVPFRWW